jgi:hypothetical protein
MWLNLIVASCLCCLHAVQTAAFEKVVDSSSEVTLTETQPAARIRLPASIRAAPAATLEVPVVRISNPQEMSFSIFASLEWRRPAQASTGNEKIQIGVFTVYPPDRTGSYMLRASTAFEKLKAMGVDLGRDQVVILLEMKRTNPNKAWSAVQVEIAPLRWKSDNP